MNRGTRVVIVILGVVIGLLLLIRFVGSPIVTAQVNRRLEALPGYRGHIDAVQLALWRGTISARGFQLTDRTHENEGPVVTIKHAMASIAWLPLFKGRLGGHAAIDGVDAVMIKRPFPAGTSDKEKRDAGDQPMVREWQALLQKTFPFEVTRFELKDARLRFEDQSAAKPAAMVIDQIELKATGLTNRPAPEQELPAHVTLNARVGESGVLAVDIRANSLAEAPSFETRMELTGLSLPKIHDFLVAYALIDVHSGTFEMYSEVTASDGHYQGYVKPFFKDLKFDSVPDPNKNLAQRAATAVASKVTDLLKSDEGNIATKAPFQGDLAKTELSVWVTVENLLRNAFVQALRTGLEGQSEGT